MGCYTGDDAMVLLKGRDADGAAHPRGVVRKGKGIMIYMMVVVVGAAASEP